MTTTRSAVLIVVAVVGLTVAPVASAALATGFAAQDDEGADEEPDNTSMGAEVSEFMQSSAASADHAVETRMFDAAYRNADENHRADVVSDRATTLEQRLAVLEREHEELTEQRDEMNPVAYDARMTRLTVQITSLENAINETEPRADESGVGTDSLADLRTSALALSGPEIAERASQLIGVDTLPEQAADGDAGERISGEDGDLSGDDKLAEDEEERSEDEETAETEDEETAESDDDGDDDAEE